MNQATPALRIMVRYLLETEANKSEQSEAMIPALCVLTKLRSHLTKRVGPAGFAALLTRALALAKMEVPWLEAVQVKADTNLEGFSEAAQQQSADSVAEGGISLLAQLLGLLFTFIGETLTMGIVRELWPDARLEGIHSGAEETPK